jgi:hypothetical protein
MFKPMMFGAMLGAIAMGLLVVWANEVNVGLQLKSLNCYPTSHLGTESYLCYVEG